MKVSYLWPKQCNEHTKLKTLFEKPLLQTHRFALGSPPVLLCEGLCLEPPPWTLFCSLLQLLVIPSGGGGEHPVSLGNEESTFFSWSQLKERINHLQACLSVFLCQFLHLGIQPTCSPVTSVPLGAASGVNCGSSSLTLWALPVTFRFSRCLQSTPTPYSPPTTSPRQLCSLALQVKRWNESRAVVYPVAPTAGVVVLLETSINKNVGPY